MNQEGEDFEDENDLKEYIEDVYDERTGGLLDAKLTLNVENEEVAAMEQLEVGIESTEDECEKPPSPPSGFV